MNLGNVDHHSYNKRHLQLEINVDGMFHTILLYSVVDLLCFNKAEIGFEKILITLSRHTKMYNNRC